MARRDDTYRSLPGAAQRFIAVMSLVALAAVGVATVSEAGPPSDLWLLALLVSLCAAGNAFEILAPGQYSLQPNYAAFLWGAVLLPPWCITLLAVACFLPAWCGNRVATHKTAFNVVNYVLTGLVANALIAASSTDISAGIHLSEVGALVAAAIAGATVNHLLMIVAVAYADQQSLRAAAPHVVDGLPVSIGVGLTGAAIAVLWTIAPVAVLLAAGPVALVHRALRVPMLRHRAVTDAKTGLYNSEHFREELAAQLDRAGRAKDRVAVAMVDLDHLRAINSRCGHLAGDRAIRAVADELAALASRHGAAGRFGGEEFSLVLPGFDGQAARGELDEIRLRLRSVDFREARDLRVSFSAGVAVFPDHGETVDQLLAAADAALYDAKAAGRDRVRLALSAISREVLDIPAVTGSEAPQDQPLPAASAAAAGLSGAGRLFSRRRRRDRRPSSVLRRELDDTRALLGRMQRSHLETIGQLARAMEDKDPFREGSTERVAALAVRLATELGFPPHDLRAVALGAVLRDIGTVGVRDAVLLKGGRLDALEREEVRRHTDLASQAIADLELPIIVKQMVRSHHERWDGTGYPDGLAGEDIPLAARILAVADALDAMLSPRPYRPALGALEAHAQVAAEAGRQFCPTVAEALTRSVSDDPGWTATVAQDSSRTASTAWRSGRVVS